MNLKPETLTPQTVNLLAEAITEKVAKRIQELNGLYGTPANFNLKDAIFVEVVNVLQDGVEI